MFLLQVDSFHGTVSENSRCAFYFGLNVLETYFRIKKEWKFNFLLYGNFKNNQIISENVHKSTKDSP